MADFSGQRTARVSPSPGASPSPIAVFGRTYSNGGPGSVQDVPLPDAFQLGANGWTVQSLSGTSGMRPSPRDADWLGSGMPPWSVGGQVLFFDTTLSLLLRYDPSSATGWRRTDTQAAA